MNKSRFENLTFLLPDRSIQDRVVNVLSAYDDLIENNTKRIKILEEMARSLYREWFIEFRFPGHENVKLLETEIGHVPTGWTLLRLGDEVEFAYGKALKEVDRTPGDVPVFGSSGLVGWHNEALAPGPGIIVGRKGNVGTVHWSPRDFYAIDTVFFIRTEIPLRYVYFNLERQKFLNSDAAVPGLSRNQAYALPFLVPADDVLRRFQDLASTLMGQSELLRCSIENLRTTRDLLLPRLISGEIELPA